VHINQLDALTATEREVLDAIVERYGRWSAGRLIDETLIEPRVLPLIAPGEHF